MVSFLSDLRASLLAPPRLILWGLLSLAVGLAGPFGTYSLFPFPLRMLFWTGIVGVSIAIVVTARLALLRWFPAIRYLWISVSVALLLAVLLTGAIRWVIRPAVEQSGQAMEPAWVIFGLVFAIALCIDGLRFFYVKEYGPATPGPQSSAIPASAAAAGEPRLLRRLPDDMKGPILHLGVRDHIVDVRTDKGVVPVRIRLSDAIGEVEGVDGLCTHRSHWVAIAAVKGHGRDRTRPVLILTDGTRVPVSRKFQPEVAARGLLGET